MNNDPRPRKEFDSDDRRRFSISLPIVVGSLFVVLSSWLLFLVSAWEEVALITFPLLFITLLIAVVVWLLKWMKFKPWSIETGRRGLVRYVAVVLIGIVAAPLYGYVYGILMARSFVQQLALEVRVESQEVLLVVTLPYGKPPRRGVTTHYVLLEPVDGAIARLTDRIQDKDDWKISNHESFRAKCWNSEGIGSTELELKDDGALQVAIEYGTHANCLLR